MTTQPKPTGDLPATDPSHPQWKRRRHWNMAGAIVGLASFVGTVVTVWLGEGSPESVATLYASGGLFLVSSGIYAATALMRTRTA